MLGEYHNKGTPNYVQYSKLVRTGFYKSIESILITMLSIVIFTILFKLHLIISSTPSVPTIVRSPYVFGR